MSSNTASTKTFFGHPIGLFVLFFTEMWERFSYYGMRALLMLYMTKHLIGAAESGAPIAGYSTLKGILEFLYGPLELQPLASQIYGTYTAFVYLTPLFGGMIADRWLGPKRSVVLGGVLMAFGHFLMAFETLFFPALVCLILGNGCFKPNISTQVGHLYPEGDPRRDRAFGIFYMGVNLGAVFSPLVCGTLGQVYGWHYGFTAAGIGMVIGLAVYLGGQRYLGLEQKKERVTVEKTPLTPGERRIIWSLFGVCALNIVFWGVYEQQGNTIQLFADQNTDWRVFGWELPSTWFQSMNPLLILLLTPLLNVFWGWQEKRGNEPSSLTKMALGCATLGISFFILMVAAKGLGADQKISVLWLLGCTFVYTLGELYLSPIGLSLFSKVSPARTVGMMIGVWYLSSFFGNYLSGFLGMFYSRMAKEHFFLMLAVLGIAAGGAMFAFKGMLERNLNKGARKESLPESGVLL